MNWIGNPTMTYNNIKHRADLRDGVCLRLKYEGITAAGNLSLKQWGVLVTLHQECEVIKVTTFWGRFWGGREDNLQTKDHPVTMAPGIWVSYMVERMANEKIIQGGYRLNEIYGDNRLLGLELEGGHGPTLVVKNQAHGLPEPQIPEGSPTTRPPVARRIKLRNKKL